MRFCGSASDATIRRFCEQRRGLNSVVLGFFADGELRGAGELTVCGSTPWPIAGELALSVEGPFQNRGVGSELARQLVVIGSNRWVSRIRMLWLLENLRMRAIASRYGPQLHTESGQIECEIRPPWPTYLSVLEELLTDGSSAGMRGQNRSEKCPEEIQRATGVCRAAVAGRDQARTAKRLHPIARYVSKTCRANLRRFMDERRPSRGGSSVCGKTPAQVSRQIGTVTGRPSRSR